jgi:hypothetical protein
MTATTLPAPTGTIKPAQTPASATATPTIDQSVHVDIGSAIATLFRNSEPMAETLINFGVTAALHEVPFGTVVVAYAVPVVDQYVKSAFSTLEGTLGNLSVDAPAGNIVLDAAAKMFNANEAALSSFLGGAIPQLFQAAVTKLGLPMTAAAPAATQAANPPVQTGR